MDKYGKPNENTPKEYLTGFVDYNQKTATNGDAAQADDDDNRKVCYFGYFVNRLSFLIFENFQRKLSVSSAVDTTLDTALNESKKEKKKKKKKQKLDEEGQAADTTVEPEAIGEVH